MARTAFTRMDEPVHLMVGDSAGGTILNVRPRRDGIVARDNLAWGPCDADPVRHGEIRRAFWRAAQRERDRRAGQWSSRADLTISDRDDAGLFAARIRAFPEGRPLLFWTTEAWMDSLWFWWALDAIERAGVSRERCWVARPAAVGAPDDCLGFFAEVALNEAFDRRTPLDAGLFRSGAALWRKFAAASPAGFDPARRQGVRRIPSLSRLGERHSWFFPRLEEAEGRLRLSHFDQGLLDRFDRGAWRTAHAALCYAPDLLADYVHLIGDGSMVDRLHAWAAHRPDDPALLSRREDGAGWAGASFRLTPLGERIRRDGLDHPSEAPPMFVGGCEVYAGERPWVRLADGVSWRLARLRR
jgi:hypothetical protein